MLVLSLRGGCIASPIPAVFDHHYPSTANDPGHIYLQNESAALKMTPLQARELLSELGGELNPDFKYHSEPMLSSCARDALITRLETHLAVGSENQGDVRMTLSLHELEEVIGGEALQGLTKVFSGSLAGGARSDHDHSRSHMDEDDSESGTGSEAYERDRQAGRHVTVPVPDTVRLRRVRAASDRTNGAYVCLC